MRLTFVFATFILSIQFFQIATVPSFYEIARRYLSAKDASIISFDLDKTFKLYEKNWRNYYYEFLPQLIRKYSLKKGCEIGVAFGGHSEAILMHTDLQILYSVDPYLVYCNSWLTCQKSTELITDQDYWDIVYEWVKERLFLFGDRSKLMRKPSIEVADLIEDESLDFVFIDGLHTYEGVKADLEAWFTKVRPGGFIIGDDYKYPRFPGVTQAVDEFFKPTNLQIITEHPSYKHFWYVQKTMNEYA